MQYDHRLRTLVRGSFCVYCGEPANTMDHFPPRVYSAGGFLLPCCSECNSMAGADFPLNFADRANLVNRKIRKKYAKELIMPEWNEHEIMKLSGNLKRRAALWQERRRVVKERVAWNAIAYLSLIDHSNAFAVLDADNDFMQESEDLYTKKLKL